MMKSNYLILLTLICLTCSCTENKPMETITLYVGTYTDTESEGIYRYSFDPNTGDLKDKMLVATLTNPSFVKISKDRRHLYSVSETAGIDSLGGEIAAFKIGKDSLQLLGTQATGGQNPCHLSISEDGKLVAVSNYSGGNLAIFPRHNNGSLDPYRQLIDHKVLDTTRTSHVHSSEFTPDGLFVADLGLDAIKRYRATNTGFVPALQPSLDLPKGAGPRHFTFGQGGAFLYVINEYNSSITVFKRNGEGQYALIVSHSTVAADFKGESFCAEIQLSEDGKFLYGSNRGENTIVVFAVNQQSGDLTLAGSSPVEGDWPRNFTIDPTGKFLLVANQNSNNISIFSRDSDKGTLSFLKETDLSKPVYLEFLK